MLPHKVDLPVVVEIYHADLRHECIGHLEILLIVNG